MGILYSEGIPSGDDIGFKLDLTCPLQLGQGTEWSLVAVIWRYVIGFVFHTSISVWIKAGTYIGFVINHGWEGRKITKRLLFVQYSETSKFNRTIRNFREIIAVQLYSWTWFRKWSLIFCCKFSHCNIINRFNKKKTWSIRHRLNWRCLCYKA